LVEDRNLLGLLVVVDRMATLEEEDHTGALEEDHSFLGLLVGVDHMETLEEGHMAMAMLVEVAHLDPAAHMVRQVLVEEQIQRVEVVCTMGDLVKEEEVRFDMEGELVEMVPMMAGLEHHMVRYLEVVMEQ